MADADKPLRIYFCAPLACSGEYLKNWKTFSFCYFTWVPQIENNLKIHIILLFNRVAKLQLFGSCGSFDSSFVYSDEVCQLQYSTINFVASRRLHMHNIIVGNHYLKNWSLLYR